MQEILKALFSGAALGVADAEEAMDHIMAGQVPEATLGAFLGFLAGRGLTAPVVAGSARSLRKHARAVPVARTDLVDTCGTGGDGAHTFNISTVNAFILAAAGAGVAKHGNRSVSSRSGSADVIEALGLPVDVAPERAARMIDRLGFGFLFAPSFHPAMARVAPVRRLLGVRTLFNVLGPLANPAPVKRQVIGVYDAALVPLLADVALLLGAEDVLVVAGRDGLDEITNTTTTDAARVRDGRVTRVTLSPDDFGFAPAPAAALRGGDAHENARTMTAILQGEAGPRREICVMNAAAALVVAGKATDFFEGRALAEAAIDSGAAWGVVEACRAFRE